jgi:virulence-associated protein VapD
MYAISFDMEVAKLKEYYGDFLEESCRAKVRSEIRLLTSDLGFYQIYNNTDLYISREGNDLTHVYKVINKLSDIPAFKAAVFDLRVFKVEEWSDFTDIVKGK